MISFGMLRSDFFQVVLAFELNLALDLIRDAHRARDVQDKDDNIAVQVLDGVRSGFQDVIDGISSWNFLGLDVDHVGRVAEFAFPAATRNWRRNFVLGLSFFFQDAVSR